MKPEAIKANIAGRKKAETMVPKLEKAAESLEAASQFRYWEALSKATGERAEALRPEGRKRRKARRADPGWSELMEEIEWMADDHGLTGNAANYIDSAYETAKEIAQTIKNVGRTTDAQMMALQNLKEGIARTVKRN